MTIRKRWILTLAFIAIISILVNSFVLSILTSRYFNQYLDETYQSRCKEIVAYLKNEFMDNSNGTTKVDTATQTMQMEEGLDSYLGESIIQIKVYDDQDNLIAQAKDESYDNGKNSMNNMMGMMGRTTRGYDVVDVFNITDNKTVIGVVHITRFTTSANSYAAKMFQSSLIRNSAASLVIVIFVVFFLGWFMSKRISRDLRKTADMAREIDLGTENTYELSNTAEIRAIQQSLQSLGSRLKLKQKARKTLVDEMVHQTRTPLTILKMHLEGIEDGVIDMQPEEMKVCENQIQNLSDIIINISSLIEADAEEKEIQTENFELYQFLKQISNGMRAQFEKKQIHFELLSNEKIQMNSDKYKIGQSIYNILTNAYKFTAEQGKVELRYQLEKEEVLIQIKDNGCGMTQEEQEHIFDAYYKNDMEIGKGGDGLGLYVAKQNIEGLGGRIQIESKKGSGSSFTLRIPMK